MDITPDGPLRSPAPSATPALAGFVTATDASGGDTDSARLRALPPMREPPIEEDEALLALVPPPVSPDEPLPDIVRDHIALDALGACLVEAPDMAASMLATVPLAQRARIRVAAALLAELAGGPLQPPPW